MSTISNLIQQLEAAAEALHEDLQEAKDALADISDANDDLQVSKDAMAAELRQANVELNTQIAVNEAQAAKLQEHAATIETLRKALRIAEGLFQTNNPLGVHQRARIALPPCFR